MDHQHAHGTHYWTCKIYEKYSTLRAVIFSWTDTSSRRTAQQLWWTEGTERNRLSMLRGDVPFHNFGSREPMSGHVACGNPDGCFDFPLRFTHCCSRSCLLPQSSNLRLRYPYSNDEYIPAPELGAQVSISSSDTPITDNAYNGSNTALLSLLISHDTNSEVI